MSTATMRTELRPTVCLACRLCGSGRLEIVLEMGDLYVSDFPRDGRAAHLAPLTVVQCQDCSFVQLRHTVPPDWLYREYWFRSGTNEQMVAALRNVAQGAMRVQPHARRILDIGANDGTLLRLFPEGLERVGFEPADNLIKEAAQGGNHIIPVFYPSAVSSGPFDIITSIAMFYDLDDPNAFVAAIARDLAPDGVWIVQQAYLPAMLLSNGIDNLSHEHLGYHTVRTMQTLCDRHGLHIEDVQYNQVNGGSFRCYIRHGHREDEGFTDPCTDRSLSSRAFREFAERAQTNKAHLRDVLQGLREDGKRIYGYGASTRGNTLLQWYGLGPDLLVAIADRDPRKVGRRTVGTEIPIVSEEMMRAARPDYLFVLPWHLMEVFRTRERAFIEQGGKFIVPLPTLRVEP